MVSLTWRCGCITYEPIGNAAEAVIRERVEDAARSICPHCQHQAEWDARPADLAIADRKRFVALFD